MKSPNTTSKLCTSQASLNDVHKCFTSARHIRPFLIVQVIYLCLYRQRINMVLHLAHISSFPTPFFTTSTFPSFLSRISHFSPHNAEQMLVSLCNYSAFVSVDIISACGQPINCSVAPVLARVICPCFVVVTVTGTRLRLPGGRVPERPFWATEGIENMAFVITELFVDT